MCNFAHPGMNVFGHDDRRVMFWSCSAKSHKDNDDGEPIVLRKTSDVFSKIEPYHSVSRAVPLGLSFIAKWGQRRGGHIGGAACDDQCRQAHRVRK